MAPSDTLRTSISDEEALRIQDLLKRKKAAVSDDRREHYRYSFEGSEWVVSLKEVGATAPADHAVYARNISRRGIGFFHHGRVQAGTRCVLRLVGLDGQRHEIAGTVVRCMRVEDMIYEIGVRTTADVNVGLFDPDAQE